ncbi:MULTISPECIES: exodeoxyribonuclease VII large subunit [unclassified Sphingopyxis]|jgi:exodeoxyribonuclease VII large subunit|uniref:exodeoxyribonuclease VII large subunit n=1 Tax=unclassified Sphingopyxis TaxID=2614943 RepID=UPI0006BEBEA1|nr:MULTISPECIES: exodeoxyribonuclease VII large subunit [unclassified Sphingopyxis]USI77015.1 exodeoxyribonuclease VII large subunit [Sphingopyxis sp. USTB-05]GAO80533.1 exodeoxyribonuclease VII large subunit [Sphingopyxis sp. C-1]
MSVPFPDTASDDGTEARLLAEASPGDNAPALSVSQLSAAIKRTVEDGFARVRVRGELSGTKRAASGHFYAALKDDNALIDMVMWKGQAGRLAFRPEDGIEVIATGKLTTYPGRSKYQLVVDTLEVAGEGALMLLFEKLKARLGAEGLFDRERKYDRLPYLPRTIGVVTSPTGAVIRDILHRLADRCPTHVIVWPVLVQGDGAAAQVANAIRGFDAIDPGGRVPRPDLVIVARGGGSIEDLWAFNEEVVVRAIADCRIPTISAVGHETDVTLADYAADVRAPTPTAAAEMAVPVRAELISQLATWNGRIIGAANRHQALAGERLTALARHLPKRDALYAPQRQRLDDAGDRLDRSQRHRLTVISERLATRGAAMRPALLARRWDRDRALLEGLGRLLDSLDPRALLSRGYAMVRDAGGAIVTTAAKARGAGHLQLQFADGEVPVAVGAGDGAPPPTPTPKPVRKPSPAEPKRGQGELF